MSISKRIRLRRQSGKKCVEHLRNKLADLQQLEQDNDKMYLERMSAMAVRNRAESDAQQAQNQTETDAKRRDNDISGAANARKISIFRRANLQDLAVMRVEHAAEMGGMRRKDAEDKAAHEVSLRRLQAQNRQQMDDAAIDHELKLSELEQGVDDAEQWHQDAFLASETAHQCKLSDIARKHRAELAQGHTQEDGELEMTAMAIEDEHEMHELRLRHKDEVYEQSKANGATEATQTAEKEATRQQHQDKMDTICHLMHDTKELKGQLKESTARCFALNKKVNDERDEKRSAADVQRESDKQLTVQMELIEAAQQEIAGWRTRAVPMSDPDDLQALSDEALEERLEELYPLLHLILSEQKERCRSVKGKITGMLEITDQLLILRESD